MPQIDIDFEVFKKLTSRRQTKDITCNDVIRWLLKLPQQAKSQIMSAANGSDPWIVSDTSFLAGSEFMADYKGKVLFRYRERREVGTQRRS
ncbi:hypothetical protein [Edaphobacter aggregans]|uniref:hypothetical protein n=1 Tax=Edaphobacter aggregans TaxID=570835 RepID=UPI000554F0AA|nr:hypothetical protein [Edaphobacter aggregans]